MGQGDKQRVIPPSPQAQQFMKYIDYPVDYSSGLPKIDIPVYTIQCGDLTLPISISYHSSGLKPSEDTGFIGLGWTLNYGGIISRTMKGYPDEKFYSSLIRNESEYTSSSDQQVIDPYNYELVSTINGSKDTQYDIFYYSIPNQQGRFIFKRNADINLFKQPVLLPYHPVKISPNISSINDGFDYFDVTDDKGVSYRFGKSLKSSIDETEYYRAATNPTNAERGNSAWLLTEIISTDKSDTISFEYEFIKMTDLSNLITKTHKIFSRSWTQYLGGGNQSYPNTYSTPSSTSAYEYTTKRLKTIKFKKNELRFTYNSAYYPNSLLTKIEIFDKATSSIIQSVGLTQTKYHSINDGRLNWDKLDLIQFYDKNSLLVKKYQFAYDNSVAFPPIDILETNETSAVDFWGYYNTSCCNNDMIPPNSLYFDGQGINRLTGNANRNANSVWSKLGMLTQIVYPEGGSVNFSYKGNKIGSNEVGGVCLDNIISSTGGSQIKKTYEYNSAFGINTISEQYYFSRSISVISDGAIFANYTASSDLGVNINLNDRPVVYTDVTEYLGDQTTNTGKIVHKYDSSQLCTNLSLDYLLTPAPLYLTYVNWNYGPFGFIQNEFKYGELLENETSVYDSSNSLKKNTKKYYTHSNLEAIKGLSVSLLVNEVNYHEKNGHYNLSTYTINQLAQKLDSVATSVYGTGGEGPFVTRENYTYNSYLLPSSCSTKNSDGKSISVYYRYPFDINAAPYTSMVGLNMLNYLTEQYTVNNGYLISGIATTFKIDDGHYLPAARFNLEPISPLSAISFKPFGRDFPNPDTNYKSLLSFDDYDSFGNLLQTTSRDGITTAYLWNSIGNYLMAEVKGATYSQISSQDGKAANYSSLTLRNSLNGLVPNSLIQTFSYTPLVGMTSQTDPNGVTTYFDYDSFGRLKLVKNDDTHILKRYTHHYKQ